MNTHTYKGIYGEYLTSVTVSSTDEDSYHDLDGTTVSQFKDSVDKLFSKVPEEYHDSAVVNVYCDDNYGSTVCSMTVRYARPATDLEIQQFKSRENNEKNRKIQRLEHELERLKNETSN